MLNQIFAGFLGALISLACLVPPFIHFVTGPIGPFIGGFIGGLICNYNKKAKYFIGISIGIFLAMSIFLFTILVKYFGWTIFEYINKTQLSQTFETATVFKFIILTFLYSSVLGILGVHYSLRLKSFLNKNSDKPSSN